MIASPHRPTAALIHLENITFNIKQVQRHIKQDAKIFAVVKANAYGHGAVQVAKAVQQQVDGFCVSNLDEALELRRAGLEDFILILGVLLPEEVALANKKDITVTVADLEWLDRVQAKKIDLNGLSVHIKVDSGMGRIGVRSSKEADELIAGLQKAGACVDGIFTHFATADEASATKFNQQLEKFNAIVTHLSYKPQLIHASNSATSIWHSDTVMNAVRLGIVMYGLNPSGKTLKLPYELKPALELKSMLVQVKEVQAGDTIGYGATYRAKQAEFIGTVPIGYADGWTRALQDFYVLVDGQYCQIVGRISMDQITIRLPKAYPLGTEVTLIGDDGSLSISATDIAQKRETINYEVLCLLSDRIPRKYK
ncbi:alanine racemase [Streptococcus macacae]|uniref:Alanine racemase n=1 Tax=Streptococcus macacae NCTC 11558 TaxID=764298 RepID=G5JXD6_9STRE|nr:alanine racemase [Streptococcus macacae]EHJ52787.1 alanine racemase [Streptococcus macacae NCTC 11558]SUN79188.1 alanine racemase [Streptococcus macacae NCTC 11558]